ncbi:MAG: polyprenyl synthetase family protein [Dehalococcoidia bacterium]
MGLPKAFQRYRPVLDASIKAAFEGRDLFLYDMQRYHMGWVDEEGGPFDGPGKCLRPLMCLLACEAVGGVWQKALPAATALELVHNFSLIHDDIQDGDTERRHRPTVWHRWGMAQGINAGDSMRGLGTLAILKGSTEHHPPCRVLAALEALENASLEMIEGQYLDISYEHQTSITIDEYLDMVSKKTGALMECSFYLGALLGTDNPDTVESLRRCGRELGLVFQIRDDTLGVWGVEECIGKSVASDIRRKKMCLPVVYALQTASGADQQYLHRLYEDRRPAQDEEVDEVLAILDRLRAMAHCQSLAQEHCQGALAALDGVELAPCMRTDIWQLATFFVEREH